MPQQELSQETGTVDDGRQCRGVLHRISLPMGRCRERGSGAGTVNRMDATALGRNAVRSIPVRFGTVRWGWVVGWLAVAFLVVPTATYLGNIPHWPATLGAGDWHNLGLVNPANPYADNGFYRWAPIAAWGWTMLILPMGVWLWTALHFVALAEFRNWRVALLAIASWPFWTELQQGSAMIFIVLAAWWALKGSRAAVIAYVVLFALMPRPLMVPVLVWLLWHRTDARWALGAAGTGVVASSVLLGQMMPWLARLTSTGSEITALSNIGPSALIGLWWLPIGLALAAWLTWQGRLGLASLAASPYLIGYYLLFGLLDLRR